MIKKLLVTSAFVAALFQSASAAVVKPLPTSFVQNIGLQLMVVAPGKTAANFSSATVSNVTLVTKDAIKAIGLAAGHPFSAKAKLVCVTSISYYTNKMNVFGYLGTPVFQIRDGTNIIDVTPFFTIATLNNSTFIQSYTMTKQGGYSAFKSYRVRSITVSNPGLTFTGQGFVQSPLVNVTVKPGVVVLGNNDNWTSFTGVATEGAVTGILQGTINATYSHLE